MARAPRSRRARARTSAGGTRRGCHAPYARARGLRSRRIEGTPTGWSPRDRLVPDAVRLRALLAEPPPLVRLVLLVVPREEGPPRLALGGEDVRRDPVEEPAVVGDDE